MIQVLGSIEEKENLSSYMTEIRFNVKLQNKAIYKKMEEIYKKFEEIIEKNPNQDFKKLNERIGQFKRL
jgi:hypothetical protein